MDSPPLAGYPLNIPPAAVKVPLFGSVNYSAPSRGKYLLFSVVLKFCHLCACGPGWFRIGRKIKTFINDRCRTLHGFICQMGISLRHLRAAVRHKLLQGEQIHLAATGKP